MFNSEKLKLSKIQLTFFSQSLAKKNLDAINLNMCGDFVWNENIKYIQVVMCKTVLSIIEVQVHIYACWK